uniref:Reverse transcriptase domain-containing protein n=1 Tax=Tanacetum cinerariifolium TaxID=118510 RepID=A0A6L2P179_TANCI|nr:hypothetical protein [Tanacetum cinerariifolium]
MADHSQKWHEGSPSQGVCSSNNSEGMAAIVSKLDNLGLDMNKLKENVHAIQVGCQLCDGPHLDKECPLNEEAKSVEEVKYGEGHSSPFNGAKYHVGPPRTQIEQLKKEVHAKAATEVPTSSVGQCKAVYDDAPINDASSNETDNIHGVSFINMHGAKEDDDLPFEDLGASINIMPKSMFEHLKVANLKETDMLVEMADMTKKVPLGVVENILVKIDKFLFSSDFVNIDILKTRNKTMILGRPFLATIHAEIDIFNKEISLGMGNDNSYRKTYMVNTVHRKDLMNIDCDLFLYESESCEFNRLLAIDLAIFAYDIYIQESYIEIAYRCCMIAQGKPRIDKEENETGMGPAQKRMH